MDVLVPLVRALHERSVRFVLIGVGGANYYAHAGAAVFTTEDRDLLLPLEPDNLVTLVMKGYDFDPVWNERRTFKVEGVDIPVARLLHIVTSKHAAGRDKGRLFLATHRDALEQWLRREADEVE